MGIFFAAVAALVAGYVVYGALVDRIFGIDANRPTPAMTMADGVDFVPMPVWKVVLVQLLNIAGVGPIFGPILGALYGPAALIWIVIGCIFAGGVHDYFSGMLSIRHDGASVPEIVGDSLGNGMKQLMRVFSVILLLLVGIVFVSAPAQLLTNLTPLSMPVLVIIIFCYYFIATIMPVDKIIGKIYPVFGFALVFMAISTITMLMVKGYELFPQRTITNINPNGLPMWPLIFITIACGALSGFHATQSPLMARCLTNERYGRPVFYGSMIMEGIIALIWATLAMSFFKTPQDLQNVLGNGGPAQVVNLISTSLLGKAGGVLAIVGVVFLPISSGDTAFRSARLIIADFMRLSQKEHSKRLLIAVPLFALGFVISKTDFGIIWRYFGWANQTLATIVLWTAASYLKQHGKCHWIASLPAAFMTTVVVCFLFHADIGFGLALPLATWIGIGTAIGCAALFLFKPVAGTVVKTAALLLPALFVLSTPTPVQADDQWTATVTGPVSTCKNIGKDIEGDYDLEVHRGSGRSVSFSTRTRNGVRVFYGVRTADKPVVYKFTSSALKDGGVLSEDVHITLESEDSGHGNSTWNWSDGLMSCGGSYRFTLRRKGRERD